MEESVETFLDDKILLGTLRKIYIEMEAFQHAFDCYEKIIKINPYNEQAENKIKILKPLL
ncbi:MAG: hypothetical protein KJI71_00670 [Patescibacteria group bacterium]|nr:hypothetical protein [Patescibacteria group bacterium]